MSIWRCKVWNYEVSVVFWFMDVQMILMWCPLILFFSCTVMCDSWSKNMYIWNSLHLTSNGIFYGCCWCDSFWRIICFLILIISDFRVQVNRKGCTWCEYFQLDNSLYKWEVWEVAAAVVSHLEGLNQLGLQLTIM